MRIQIRKHCFETNSSSVHCISVTKEKPEKFYHPEWEWVRFRVGEFGWEHRTYYGTDDKASYLWTVIVSHFIKRVEDEETFKGFDGHEYHKAHTEFDVNNPEYLNIKKKIVNALKSIEITKERIEFQETFESDSWGYLRHGYVDHTPSLDFVYDIINHKDRLLRYLFNDNSMISTGNDNDGSSNNLDSCEDPEWEYLKVN